ncbi:hypothetical protein HPG69_015489, partial [Diceros bicornis minor]
VVLLLPGAVLPRREARPRLRRRHPLWPLHKPPGTAILIRTEAAWGPAARARSLSEPGSGGSARPESRQTLGCTAAADPTMAQDQGLGSSAPACSQTLLDAVLQNLYDFGETEDEAEQKKIRKKRENKKRDVGTPAALAAEPASSPGSLIKGQRKSACSFFKELREELQCAPAVTPSGSPSGPEVPSAAVFPSPLKNNIERVEVVEFHSRSKQKKQNPDQEENTKVTSWLVYVYGENPDIARLEVHRFGITGYGKGRERVLEQERAIMLGAKPPKNSYVNYRVLQEQIKEKKAAKEEEKRRAQDTDIFKKKKRKGQEDREKN